MRPAAACGRKARGRGLGCICTDLERTDGLDLVMVCVYVWISTRTTLRTCNQKNSAMLIGMRQFTLKRPYRKTSREGTSENGILALKFALENGISFCIFAFDTAIFIVFSNKIPKESTVLDRQGAV